MSAALQWAIVHKHNSFIIKNKLGARNLFSKEANNLTNQHSLKFSGLVNPKTVGITADPTRGVVVSIKTKNGLSPKNSQKTVKLSRGSRPTFNAVAALTVGGQPDHRADLKQFALARAAALLASQKPKTVKAKKGRKTNKKSTQ